MQGERPDLIVLSDAVPIARGFERAVYQDPHDPDRLIKVLVPDAAQVQGGRIRAVFARSFSGYRRFLLRQEYREYLHVSLQDLSGASRLPITHMYGFVLTDIGLGCATQKVAGPDGGAAGTWRELIDAGQVGPDQIAAMTDFARRMMQFNVRASDLTAKNVVLGHRTFHGVPGPYEAVLVDGFGDTHAIPIRSLSRRANRAALHKRMDRLGRRAGLMWDRNTRAFTAT
ncbi:YrbL family protein [Pseudooctadecabacter jejudonensis]|uniref:PhoP regulatory network protein YrbL n=1 Tax=Pseudooctadecabacter jejudonensis TaxID=1391910 RepID=A0A1Y5RLM7_9RHOB|nr:YrbL family protein [Pseudooctadecabacter jejudonensis]SLN19278.1 hypothetical protein PSJ8397_00671 [Pseudooctadecabacter jejudonensis]